MSVCTSSNNLLALVLFSVWQLGLLCHNKLHLKYTTAKIINSKKLVIHVHFSLTILYLDHLVSVSSNASTSLAMPILKLWFKVFNSIKVPHCLLWGRFIPINETAELGIRLTTKTRDHKILTGPIHCSLSVLLWTLIRFVVFLFAIVADYFLLKLSSLNVKWHRWSWFHHQCHYFENLVLLQTFFMRSKELARNCHLSVFF